MTCKQFDICLIVLALLAVAMVIFALNVRTWTEVSDKEITKIESWVEDGLLSKKEVGLIAKDGITLSEYDEISHYVEARRIGRLSK